MSCEICGNKPMNCDCSREAKELYYLRQELEEQRQQTKANIINSSGFERRELFKQVALKTIHRYESNGGDFRCYWDERSARRITDEILTEADTYDFCKAEEKEQKG